MSTNDMVKRELGAIGIDDLIVQEVSIPRVASGSGKFYINDYFYKIKIITKWSKKRVINLIWKINEEYSCK